MHSVYINVLHMHTRGTCSSLSVYLSACYRLHLKRPFQIIKKLQQILTQSTTLMDFDKNVLFKRSAMAEAVNITGSLNKVWPILISTFYNWPYFV